MPGIVGIVSQKPANECESLVKAMVGSMEHEQFYCSGTYSAPDIGVYAGWVAHKDSFAAGQVFFNKHKDIALIFSGECFADRASSTQNGSNGAGKSNGDWLVDLYEEKGDSFIETLNGLFSGLLIDKRQRKALLFNDRYGVSRVYYHEDSDGVYFASEAKALLRVIPSTRQLCFRSVGEFLGCGAVLQNRTLFTDIYLLPAGSAWVFRPGEGVTKSSHFKPELWESQSELSSAEYYDRLKTTWARILPRYLQTSTAGLSLTGGVDSRLILAWASAAPGTMPCYTWSNRYRDCADVKIARQVAKICQQPYQTIPVDGEFLSNFPSLAEKSVYVSDGTMDVTGSLDLYVQRSIRGIAPLRISGVYGGEIMRRLVMFRPQSFQQRWLGPELAQSCDDAARTYSEELEGHQLSFTAFKQASWYMGGKLALEGSQLVVRTPYLDNDLVALAYQTPPDLLNNKIALRLISDGNPTLGHMGTDRGVSFSAVPGVSQALHGYHEFAFKAEYRYDVGMPQWLARLDHALAPLHLERLFLGRHRVHFFRLWYRDELSPFLKEMLLDSITLQRPYFRGDQLSTIVNDHVSGRRNYTGEIHKILTLELIQRKLVEQP